MDSGLLLLVTAEYVDQETSAPGLVALSREFRQQLAEIRKAPPPRGGEVDEMRARRRRKAKNAGA